MPGGLQDDPDPLLEVALPRRRVVAQDVDLAGGPRAEALEDLDGRGLARAVRPRSAKTSPRSTSRSIPGRPRGRRRTCADPARRSPARSRRPPYERPGATTSADRPSGSQAFVDYVAERFTAQKPAQVIQEDVGEVRFPTFEVSPDVGQTMTFSICQSGRSSGSGSASKTSSAAAAIPPMPTRRAARSPPTVAPRPTFTNRPVASMAANASASNMWRVWGVNGMVSMT